MNDTPKFDIRRLERFHNSTRAFITTMFREMEQSKHSRPARIIAKAFKSPLCIVFLSEPKDPDSFLLRYSSEEDANKRTEGKKAVSINRDQVKAWESQLPASTKRTVHSFQTKLLRQFPELLEAVESFKLSRENALYISLIDRRAEQIGFMMIFREAEFDQFDRILAELISFQFVLSLKTIQATKELLSQPVDVEKSDILSRLCKHCRSVLRCGHVSILLKMPGDSKSKFSSDTKNKAHNEQIESLLESRLLDRDFKQNDSEISYEPILQILKHHDNPIGIVYAEPAAREEQDQEHRAYYCFHSFDRSLLKILSHQIEEIYASILRKDEINKIFQQFLDNPDDAALHSFLLSTKRLYFNDKASLILYWADQSQQRLTVRHSTEKYKDERGVPFQFQLDKDGETSLAIHIYNEDFPSPRSQYFAHAQDCPYISEKGLTFFKIPRQAAIAGVRLVFVDRPVGVLIAWGEGVNQDTVARLPQLSHLAAAFIAFHASEGARAAVLEECSSILLGIRDTESDQQLYDQIVSTAQVAGFDNARLFAVTHDHSGFRLLASSGNRTIRRDGDTPVVRFRNNEYARDTYGRAKSDAAPFVYHGTEFGDDPDADLFGKKLGEPWAVAPLVISGRVHGQLTADCHESTVEIDQSSLRALGLLASLSALAIADSQSTKALGQYDSFYHQVSSWIVKSLYGSEVEPSLVAYYRRQNSEKTFKHVASIYIPDVPETCSIDESIRGSIEKAELTNSIVISELLDNFSMINGEHLADKQLLSAYEQLHIGDYETVALLSDEFAKFDDSDSKSLFGKMRAMYELSELLVYPIQNLDGEIEDLVLVGKKASNDSRERRGTTSMRDEVAFSRKDLVFLSAFQEKASEYVAHVSASSVSISDRAKMFDRAVNLAELSFLKKHVNKKVFSLLLESEDYRNYFKRMMSQDKEEPGKQETYPYRQVIYPNKQEAYVVSIDIRRSTELMLQAIDPAEFSHFMTSLIHGLQNIILECYGVFDKFTGDGILAFFPEFLTGEDVGLQVLHASKECHAIFKSHYEDARNSFHNVLWDAGLGIGIGYGEVDIVQEWERLTVVGRPVVYACRYGGCPAGRTYFTQQAYKKISEEWGKYTVVEEQPIQVKHESDCRAYDVRLRSGSVPSPRPPVWLRE